MSDFVDLPEVKVWEPLSGSTWACPGEVSGWETLKFKPEFRGLGEWALASDYSDEATLLTRKNLATIDWRGSRSTWGIVPHPSSEADTGQPQLEADGVGAIARLGWALALPDPTKDINSQPVLSSTDPAPYKGPAETVIKQLVSANFAAWELDIAVPASLGRGAVVSARPTMDNLFELVTNLAKLGGIGVDIGLVNVGSPDSTRAVLTLLVWTPEDKSKDVLLTADAGTIDSWDQVETEPTATRAVVAGAGTGGMDRIFQIVTTPVSVASAADWSGHRTVFVDGPSSFDPEELTQAGQQALLEGASTRTLALTSSESEGQHAFTDFTVGDTATGQVVTGASVQDAITSIEVNVDVEGGITVAATFGDPSATDAEMDIADQIGALKQAVRQQQRK